GETGKGNDGGAVLVVVEDGNVTLFLQLPLDLKAAGGGDVLQIDAAKGARNVIDRLHKGVHVLGVHTQGHRVHIAKGLEEYAFALHHRHTGLRADVAQTQHRAAVGDDCRHVPQAGEGIAQAGVPLDL